MIDLIAMTLCLLFQTPAQDKNQEPQDLREKVNKLQEEVNDLEKELEEIYKERDKKPQEPTRLNLLNPPITLFANGAARIDDDPVLSKSGQRIDNHLFLRTAEVDFRAAIDPYADGVVILSIEDDAGTGYSVDLEETYFILKKIPILEDAPLGLKLKIGRYRAPLGSTNRLHMHDMPWTTRPIPIAQYLGSEQGDFFESGYNPVGADADFLLPEVIPGAVMEMNLDVVDSGKIAITENQNNHSPAYLAHWNLFFTAWETHDVNLGASGYFENGQHDSQMLALDFLYKWKPRESGEFKSIVLGGEIFYTNREFAKDDDGDGIPDRNTQATPFGWYAFLQYQLSWHLYAGVRYDWLEDMSNTDLQTSVKAFYLTYYTSEFLRFRVGYEHRESDIAAQDGINTFLIEVNMVFGSHPTEPYWVNR